jgi:hypothetical protein
MDPGIVGLGVHDVGAIGPRVGPEAADGASNVDWSRPMIATFARHLCPLLGNGLRRRPADAGVATRDQSRLPVEPHPDESRQRARTLFTENRVVLKNNEFSIVSGDFTELNALITLY